MKKYPFLLLLFSLSFIKLYSQCTYTGTPLSQVGSAYTFCIDNTNTFTTPSVRSGQFVVVNVVKGFRYTFSVGNVFTAIGQNENLTIIDASTNSNVSPATFASGVSGATISNWTASLTGQIKILLSRSTCINDNTVGGALTLTLNAVGNTQDSETNFGINQWVGHIYNYTGGPPPGGTSPSTPSTTVSPFISANYVGYYNVPTESIAEGFGGSTTCFPFMSNGISSGSIYTELYAVRYRMRSTKTGCYFLNIAGDDGVRVYIDGVLVVNEWKQQGTTNYCNNLIYLNGSSDIIFDFYEYQGGNVANFSLTPFVPSTNTIAGASEINRCSGLAPGTLDGSAYLPCAPSTIPNVLFQWQVSLDNSTFTNITGATSEDYAPPAITTTTNAVRYYRRVLKAVASNAGSCEFYTNVIKVTTSASTALTISGAISGVTTQCSSLTNQVYSIASVANALNYTWTVPTGWTITSGQGSTSITVTTGLLNQNGNIGVTASNGCVTSAVRNLAVTVIQSPIGGAISGGSSSICLNSSTGTMNLGGGYTGSIVRWEKRVDSGSWINIANATINYSEIPSQEGTWEYRVLVGNGSCNPVYSSSFFIVVNPLPTASVSGNSGPVVCLGSDITFSLTGTSGAVVTYNLNGGSNTTATLTSGSATVTVLAAIASQTLNLVSVTDGTCPVSLSGSSSVVIESTTWDGTAWSDGLPTSTKAVNFTGNYSIGANFDACSISVSNNAVVSVTSGFNVTLNGAITVASGSSFTLNNNANLLQSNPAAVNTGNIIVRRQSNPLIRLDYTMWSSPVTGQGLYAFSPFTFANRFYVYNTSSNLYTTTTLGLNVTGTNAAGVNGTDIANVLFATGKGYLIRLPYNHPTAPIIFNGSFTGVPNNGTKTITLANISATQQFNAVGNPYPSPIDIEQFATDNASNIEPTLYFWRKTNNTASPSYCTWNTTSATFGDNGEAYTNSPNGVIQTGQGFLVEAKDGATSLEFNNGQRITDNANQFFRANTAATTTNEAHRIWLNLTGTGAQYSQAVVGYFTNATLAADEYDSKYFNDGAVALNMVIGSTEYVIQGRPTPFQATDVVPLNYKVTTAGTYTFAIDHVDGLFTGGAQAIYIKDNQDGSYHNLSAPYTFTSAAGTFANRFELVYQTALAVDNNDFTANSINVIKQQNDVVVRTFGTTMQEVTIYDIRGRVLVTKTNINASETKINVGTTNQVLLVQVTTTEGIKATKKVVN